jgi:hypothetical protein
MLLQLWREGFVAYTLSTVKKSNGNLKSVLVLIEEGEWRDHLLGSLVLTVMKYKYLEFAISVGVQRTKRQSGKRLAFVPMMTS